MPHWKQDHGDMPLPQAAIPPTPRHHSANDIGARLARVEEHLQFAHHDRNRVERESKERARDLGAAIVALEVEMVPLRAFMAVRAYRKEIRGVLISWGGWFAKLLLALLLVLGTITGRLTPEQAKVLGAWLGLPS